MPESPSARREPDGSRLVGDARTTALVNAVRAARGRSSGGERNQFLRPVDPTRVSPAVARNVRMSP
uniref:Putative esterase A n=1 Tax=Streptomyces griseus subsp. griseus TaxID=67263 RepID=Q53IB2_STRGR